MTSGLTASSTSTQVGASELRGFKEPQPLWSCLLSGSVIPLPAPCQVGRGGRASETRRTFLGDQPGSGRSPRPPRLHLPQASCWFLGLGSRCPRVRFQGFVLRSLSLQEHQAVGCPGREWSAFWSHTRLLKRASLFTGSCPWGCISLSFVTCLLRLLDFCRNKIWASRSPLPSGGLRVGFRIWSAKSPFAEAPVFLSPGPKGLQLE